jgi:hypothetical protein
MPERLQYTVNQGGIIEVALSINGKSPLPSHQA